MLPTKKTIGLTRDKEFLKANEEFIGRLRDNKEKGLDVSQPRKEDLQGLHYGDTEVLLHKIYIL